MIEVIIFHLPANRKRCAREPAPRIPRWDRHDNQAKDPALEPEKKKKSKPVTIDYSSLRSDL